MTADAIRYAPLAVGLKPSAMQGGARLHGLERTYASAINGAFRLSVLIRYAPLAVGLMVFE
jgi:hypothetical protein